MGKKHKRSEKKWKRNLQFSFMVADSMVFPELIPWEQSNCCVCASQRKTLVKSYSQWLQDLSKMKHDDLKKDS